MTETASSPPAALTLNLKTANNSFGIWTGGANAKEMNSVNATSLLGSMRFWTAALLRADGCSVCSCHECNYIEQTNEQGRKLSVEENDSACKLCKIFGCTGLSRAFNLTVVKPDQPLHIAKDQRVISLGSRPGSNSKRFYCFTQGYTGDLQLQLIPHRLGVSISPELSAALILQITYGTLGAYDQYGCGLVDYASADGAKELLTLAATYRPKQQQESTDSGPSLRDFFFFKGVVAQNNNTDKKMAFIRNDIRERVRSLKPGNDELRHYFCGAIRGQGAPAGTHYNFTITPKGHLFGWGHFDRHGKFRADREAVLDVVKDVLSSKQHLGNTLVWRECDSRRDTVRRQPWPDFYDALCTGLSSWRQL